MTDLALPSQARLSRRGRARLKRDEPVALMLVAQREQDAIDPPFDPPDVNDVLGAHEAAEHDEAETLLLHDIAEPPLELTQEAPDEAALRAFAPSAMRDPEPAPAPAPDVDRRGQYQPPENSALKYAPRKDDVNETPVPPITIYAAWDRADIAEQQIGYFAADKHLARAEIEIERGGLDGAIAHCTRHAPDLLIVDTTLDAAALLAGLDKLARVIAPNTKLILIGAVNDVALLRELAARGVAEYIVPPARKSDLIRATCRLFADASSARVFAVIGSRGGVGASMLAQNLAWSIAERQWARTALIDLDLPFGGAASAFGESALVEPEPLEDTGFTRARVERAERLEIVTATAAFERGLRCDAEKLDAVLQAARRLNSFVVLDVPHDWNAWVKRALAQADEAIIVASPDLASLRNAEGMLRQLKALKARANTTLALSMIGMQQRCEIGRKDFLHALGFDAAVDFAFEPQLFGLAALKGQALAEVAPKAKATADIEAMATMLTGREPVKRKAAPYVSAPALSVGRPVTPTAEPALEAPPAEAAAPAKKARAKKKRAITHQPDLITYPLTFQAPGAAEAPTAAPPPAATLTPPDVRLVAALRTKALAGEHSATRRALRVAAISALILQASVWSFHGQLNGAAAAAEPAAMTVAAAAPSASQSAVHAPDPLAALRTAAQRGDAAAQYALAAHLRTGDGVAPDPIVALQWTTRAAAGGHCLAMYELGVAYTQGDGAPRDDAAAFRWFRQAAEFDVADAQYNLGLLYQQGVGVSASTPEALFWFSRAAHAGDGAAAERAAMLASFMPPADVEQAQARMRAFQPQSSAHCTPAPRDEYPSQRQR